MSISEVFDGFVGYNISNSVAEIGPRFRFHTSEDCGSEPILVFWAQNVQSGADQAMIVGS